jgi:hypothetical protein
MVKPSGLIHYSWASWYDTDETTAIGWSDEQEESTTEQAGQTGNTGYGQAMLSK